jgi:hypothetical protein
MPSWLGVGAFAWRGELGRVEECIGDGLTQMCLWDKF